VIPPPPKTKPVLRYLLLGILIVLGCFWLRRTGWHFSLHKVRQWIEDCGVYGPACFFALYVLATLAAIPESCLTAVAGTLFHPHYAILLVSAASVVAAGTAFLVARYAARDAVERRMSASLQFRRLNRLTETHGRFIAFFSRILPVFPYSVLNYGFGLTRLTFPVYLFWSWLGMIPGIVIYIYGVDGIAKGLTHRRLAWEWGSVLVILVLGLAYFSRKAWIYLSRPEEEHERLPFAVLPEGGPAVAPVPEAERQPVAVGSQA
jgi:uncharacterized membrane protein YdjX (TVP38/TMEM64 family)